MASPLPPNVHVSRHPCLRAKLSQLRSNKANARETKALIHEISLIIGAQATMHNLEVVQEGTDVSPLGYTFDVDRVNPSKISLVPILRSGLGMVDGAMTLGEVTLFQTAYLLLLAALQAILPDSVPVHHLGMFRDKSTMAAIEYYNNLPYHQDPSGEHGPSELAILVDPVIATGATACAAIESLREWGVTKILLICVISSEPGLRRAAEKWPEGVDIWVGGMDPNVDGQGMIEPGVGDIGDRLFLTIGK